MNIQYQEEVKSNVIVIAVLVLSVLILGLMTYFQLINPSLGVGLGWKILYLLLLLAVGGVLFSFRKLSIVVTDQQIIFGFGRFRQRKLLVHVERVEIGEYKFSNYLGYGIRFGRDKTIGYVPCGGKGLKIKFANDKREYFLITSQVETLKKVLLRGN